MARLASQEKAGFYPLPETVTELIASHIKAPHGGRILDPCAGAGVALLTLARELGLEPYGVELNIDRAQASAELVRGLLAERGIEPELRVIHGDYKLTLNTTHNGYNCLYLNPPYDTDRDAGRLEYKWLVETRPYLQAGGLLIMVIPQHVLGFYKMASYLSGWFADVTVYRFPDPEYSRFKQIVVMGQRNKKPVPPVHEEVQGLRDLAQSELPIITRALTTLTLPKLIVPKKSFTFLSRYIDPKKAMQQAVQSGIRKSDDWATHLAPTTLTVSVAPLMPLKVGHLVGLIAAGFLNNQILANPATGELLLIKGHAYKRKNVAESVEQNEQSSKRITTATEQVVTSIQTINAAGVIETVEPIQLSDFIEKWSDQLTNHIATNYPPSYTFNYEKLPFADTLNSLSQTRKIPRMDAWGLLPTQKHAVAALVIRLQSHNDAVLVGEMGTGKTTCGIATAAVLNAKRTLVICPPHLVDKWQREAKIVWPQIETMALTSISDVDYFFAKDTENPQLAVIAHSKAKLGSGWRHAYITKKNAKGQARCHCADCGEVLTDKNQLPHSPVSIKKEKRQLICACEGMAYQFDRRRRKKDKPGSFAEHIRREQVIRRQISDETDIPAFEPNAGYCRWPLARYIRQHHGGKLDLLLADEVHQFKAADSDQGYAFYDLVVASRKVLAMTGTIFGGKASSLFHLLYRTSPEVRRAYTDPDRAGRSRIRQKQWSRLYGVEQQIETVTTFENGKMSGKSRSSVRIRELPGASPAMLPWLINRSVFVSLADMGFVLPDYEEIPVAIAMSTEMQERYDELYYKLYEALKERLRHGDKSLLGAYVQALLCWVDSPWRDEVIIEPRTKNREDEGIEPKVLIRVAGIEKEGLFPKEQAIINLIRKEKKAGRKSLLFCQQTGTRDITGRWVRILDDAGLRAAVLKVEPKKREEWVAKQVEDGIDVIITHPRKVETGLDLMDFPTIIWMGIEYSSYTVMQASRRSWRIGQNEDVKVYFFCYGETLQEEALSLIASKIAATTRVNGDIISTQSLADLDEFASTDMVSALTNVVTQNTQTRSLKDAFREANEVFRAGQQLIGDFGGISETEITKSTECEWDLPLFQLNYPPSAEAVNKTPKVKLPVTKPIQIQLHLFNQLPCTTSRLLTRPPRTKRKTQRQPSNQIIQLSFI